MFLSFLRILKFAIQDFYRNFWLSIVTITVLMLALFSVNILIGLNAISDAVIVAVEEKVDINILISKEATQAEVDNFQAYLKNLNGVQEIKYLNKDEVFESFKQKNIDNPSIQEALREVDENPFNDTIIIKAERTSDYGNIIETIQRSDYERLLDNSNFSDPQKIISFVENLTGKAEKFGLLLTAIFSFIALLIVFNTIRVTIYTHKDEIGVMRLVGASNWFIRTPYLIEGIIYAVVAMSLKVALLYAVLQFVQPYMVSFFEYYGVDLITYFNNNFIQIFGLELLIAITLNVLSSGFAIRKYLKV